MDFTSKVSSLYGPGTFGCWLCATLSVLISWTCNRLSKERDTITNDFLAALTLPTIAAVQCLYQISIIETTSDAQTALEILDTTLAITAWFSAFGVWMFFISMLFFKRKRWFCTGLVSALCSITRLVAFVREDSRPKLAVVRGVDELYFVGSLAVLILYAVDKLADWKDLKIRKIWCKVSWTFLLLSPAIGALMLTVYFLGFWVDAEFSKDEHRSGAQGVFAFPRTGYSLSELDQAVALSAGVLTLILSIWDALASWRLSRWEKYRAWRANCDRYMQDDVFEESEISDLKRELDILDQEMREILDAPSRPGMRAVMKRWEQKT
ncbi:hypothetical protein BU26DRAFT_24460 [Trematosphaeria pertusa]|uniref:Uncharacterized protein n=1 Tax=Trematosphaeria pertusa TaxID=390896 RepID=A0A6A6J1G2_9PLEO|nr:uncharacterized protein BU26DRAFT_24460 [Trematosphaeria pertusa]KAF2256559.1 hypothetical protein BU26DRAFT_24460 [Trematosphaeria pertusa]